MKGYYSDLQLPVQATLAKYKQCFYKVTGIDQHTKRKYEQGQ